MLDSFDVSLVGKAVLAGIIEFVIGWEREDSGSTAGDRTFALVSMGATVYTAFSLAAFPENADRLIGSAVSGVGFLGTGLILRGAGGETRGLTTAAGLWITTALGVLVGAGHVVLAFALTGLVLLVLLWEEIPIVARLGLRNARSPSTDEGTPTRTLFWRSSARRSARSPSTDERTRARQRGSTDTAPAEAHLRDLSGLTGESQPVAKEADAALPPETELGDRRLR